MGAHLIHSAQEVTPPADTAGSSNPPIAEAGIPPAMDSIEPNLTGLRVMLDANGYRSVYCQMHDGVLVLWGTVPHEFDRMVVQTFVLGTVGMVPMNDQIRVQDTYAEP